MASCLIIHSTYPPPPPSPGFEFTDLTRILVFGYALMSLIKLGRTPFLVLVLIRYYYRYIGIRSLVINIFGMLGS